ncbi:transposase [Burkholderia cenocepacia]|nr:transposase [Burkholderia cenocepacia]
MTKRTRRTHSAAFKAKLTLATVKGERTLAEPAQQFDVHPNQITEWKRQLQECSGRVPNGGVVSNYLNNGVLSGALTKAGLLSAKR